MQQQFLFFHIAEKEQAQEKTQDPMHISMINLFINTQTNCLF